MTIKLMKCFVCDAAAGNKSIGGLSAFTTRLYVHMKSKSDRLLVTFSVAWI